MVSGVLMSIRPRHADAIFAGTKTVELRRRRPSFGVGTRVLVYSSAPLQRLCGSFGVGGVLEDSPDALWRQVGERAGVEREAFDAYFAGCEAAFAIEVLDPTRLAPTPLSIRPPQSYLFLRSGEPRHRALLQLAAG